MSPSKPEFPPLYGPGFYPMRLEQVRKRCVADFPLSTRRPRIMQGLEGLVAVLSQNQIWGSLWVDGSFLTEKIEPDDVDVLMMAKAEILENLSPDQTVALNWFLDPERHSSHYSDTYLIFQRGEIDPKFAEWEWQRAYWIKQYGFSRGADMKGIAIVEINGGET